MRPGHKITLNGPSELCTGPRKKYGFLRSNNQIEAHAQFVAVIRVPFSVLRSPPPYSAPLSALERAETPPSSSKRMSGKKKQKERDESPLFFSLAGYSVRGVCQIIWVTHQLYSIHSVHTSYRAGFPTSYALRMCSIAAPAECIVSSYAVQKNASLTCESKTNALSLLIPPPRSLIAKDVIFIVCVFVLFPN